MRSSRSVFGNRSGNAATSVLPTCAATSRPISSSRRSGPIGIPNSSIASSITSAGVPLSNMRTASSRYGIRMRFTTKPGLSFTTTGVLPMRWANTTAVAMTSGVLPACVMISTSGIRCTGLKKWMPMTRSGQGTVLASSVIDSAEVLVARIVSGAQRLARSAKIVFFNSRFSVAASMMT